MHQNREKKAVESIIELMSGGATTLECSGLTGPDRAYLVAGLALERRAPIVVIVPDSKTAETFETDLRFFLNPARIPILVFPQYNILPFKLLSYHNETAARRLGTLYSLVEYEVPPVVVAPVGAMLNRLIPKQVMGDFAELVMVGEELDRDTLVEKLVSGGYSPVAIVEEPGDFCVRGGILDIFSPLHEAPLRIEFFGDMVESIRRFSANTQRTLDTLQEAVLLPAREAVVQPSQLDAVISRIRKRAAVLDVRVTHVREIVDRIRNERGFPGIESLISLVFPRLDTLFDYAPSDTLFVLSEPASLDAAAASASERITETYHSVREDGGFCVAPETLYMDWAETQKILSNKPTLSLQPLPITRPESGATAAGACDFSVQDNSNLRMALDHPEDKAHLLLPLSRWTQEKTAAGFAVFLVCTAKAQAERLKTLLEPYGIHPDVVDRHSDAVRPNGRVIICIGALSAGFVWPAEQLALVTENEIFGLKHRRKRLARPTPQTQLLTFEDLQKDDLVVHMEHGIGRYDGLVRLKLNGTANDFLLLVYKGGDKLYLPVDRMGMIQKYMGVDGVAPVLDRMGGKSWERVKERVKKSTEKIAGKLLKLYAERAVRKGYAYSAMDADLREFEMHFPFEETSDQLSAIADVLADMAKETPMDRLVCGDVGYGKTEVALRAAFVAINDGKQVAMVVPTTVLAEQHFATFSERFDHYPVRVACLSRFRKPKEQREIITDLKAGKVDIVIGTHRLLQKDVGFRDLGLVVLDEEQRFGVKHKEKLKRLKKTVDVLALTATPIPRTLHLSMMGIRDISIISTPPEYRRSIVTYISEFNEVIITEAVKRELDRQGQVFFIHNNIRNIWAMADRLKRLVPDVRLDVAHGRMGEDELERVMLRFMNREIDLLVCTSIVESGLDIPSANTILINRADKFGLAQIYQLRGRVGRADEQAYAYLFIPHDSLLTKDAQKRLKVLMEHSDLGCGFQIAMSDLKIRGGGTILGASQSGHIAAVGYDMFLKLMDESIARLKGEAIVEELDPEINMSLSAYIPEDYIPDIDQRLSVYRRLAKMTELKEISELKEELTDRYGDMPDTAGNLLLKIMLRVLSIKAGVEKLDLSGARLQLTFSAAHQKNPAAIVEMVTSQPQRFQFTSDHALQAQLAAGGTAPHLAQTKKILKEIAQRVNG